MPFFYRVEIVTRDVFEILMPLYRQFHYCSSCHYIELPTAIHVPVVHVRFVLVAGSFMLHVVDGDSGNSSPSAKFINHCNSSLTLTPTHTFLE